MSGVYTHQCSRKELSIADGMGLCNYDMHILRYTAIAGRENVIAGTDCGLGGRVKLSQ